MSAHRALLLDTDDDFLALLKQSLEPCGFTIIQIRDPEVPLEEFLSEPPDLIFISVELPDKEGFSVFTRVRSLARRVPIAMATSSLSATEMSLHAKLRLHADLYLNKRALDAALLVRTLHPLLPHVAALAAEVSRHVPMPSLRDGTGSIPEWLSDGPDEGEVQAVLAGFDEVLAEGGGDLLSDTNTRRRIAELEAERDQLRRELAQARRDASSSPFSVDVVSLREEVDRSTSELSRLQFELGHRDRTLDEVRRKLVQQAEDLRRAERERSDALVKLLQYEEQLAEAKRSLGRLEEQQLAVEEAQAAERLRAQQELAAQREGDAEALLQAQLEFQGLRSTLRELEANAQSAERTHAEELAGLRASQERAIAKLEKRWAARLEQAERDHAAALQSFREQHDDALRTLADSHREALARIERKAEAERSRALREAELEAEARLGEVRRAHSEELDVLRDQQGDELHKIEAGHREALARMERERESAIRQALAEQEALAEETLKKVERAHADQLATLNQRYARERQTLESEYAAIMKQKELDLQAAMSQTVGDSRTEFQRQLEQARRGQDESIASLQRQHAEACRSLEQERKAAHKARVDAEAREAELRRVTQAQRAELESVEAALSSAQTQASEWASLLVERERELADRSASIASLEELVRDLQRGIAQGDAHQAESAPGQGGGKP